jgi:membrane protease YdiL (CAAX protease family)
VHPVCAIAAYTVAVFLGGALLAPGLYFAVHAAAPHFAGLQFLADYPFHRFVTRSIEVLALLGIWPLAKALQMTSLQSLGLGNPPGQWRHVARGLALGFGSLACVAMVVLAAGARELNADLTAGRLCRKLAGAALTAAVVSVIEEGLFRGAIFGALRKAIHWVNAMLGSSVIYALVHFFQRPESPAGVDWTSGLALLPRMLSGFWDLQQVIPGFLTLTLAGVVLALAYQRTGTLHFSVGLHAGWIFWLKSYGALTRETAGAGVWLWGTHKLIDGWIAFGAMALVCAIFVSGAGFRKDPEKVR